jgi:predicted TIM-barrel fold metal-dependent hydrolase
MPAAGVSGSEEVPMGASVTSPSPRVRALRARLAHPIVDGDGHLLESVPLFFDFLRREAGDLLAREFGEMLRMRPPFSHGDPARGLPRGGWWGTSNDALDIASCTAPGLLAHRMEALGLDFAILYPSLGLALATLPEAELRRVGVRALNRMNADICREHAARLAPSAVIPMHTPEEAVSELRFAVRELGFRIAMIPPAVARPLAAHPDAFPAACAVDRYALDSAHDYDPVWREFAELGVAVTSHGAVAMPYMPDGRSSPSNYMFNHIGGHAYQQCELAKALVMGGVPLRFPALRFGFLEGGVGWAPDLLHSLEEHWEKRSGAHLYEAYDPAHLDRARLAELLEQRGFPGVGPMGVGDGGNAPRGDWERDEFEASGLREETQLRDVFANQFYFGCEADDRSVYRAFHARGNPFGIVLRAFFSSDIGHWDVPRMSEVLLESRKLVDEGLLGDGEYRAFAFENPVRLHLEMNPRFCEGTSIEGAARALLAS